MKTDTVSASSPPYENDEHIRLVEWLEEFDGPCSEARVHALAAQLGRALESYMGIDSEILCAAFLAEYQERQHRDS